MIGLGLVVSLVVGIIITRSNNYLSSVECLSSFPRTWVPLGSTVELNPKRPNPVYMTLVWPTKHRDFIVYNSRIRINNNKDNDDKNDDIDDHWVVCDAVCPHRLAPLSEGRITNEGNLECAYHGWTFDKTGLCVTIPQATSELQAKVCPSCRIRTYPVKVIKNIIWTWPWTDVLPQPVGDPATFLEGVLDNCNTYTRELPYSYETLVENIVDPSHVPFAHHGLQGTREDAIPINLTLTSNVTEAGFTFTFGDRTGKRVRRGTGEFRAPFVIQYNAQFDNDNNNMTPENPGVFNLTVICAPSRPGWSKIIIFGGDRNKSTKKSTSPIAFLFRALPLWAIHFLSNRFLDSDLVFLHYQERNRDPSLSTDGYFMPAPADRCVSAIRKWLKEYCPSEVLPPLERDRKRLFDRWSQHSDQCQHCNELVTITLPRWRNNTYALLCLSLIALPTVSQACVVTIVCILLLRLYNMIESFAKEGEFRHYLND